MVQSQPSSNCAGSPPFCGTATVDLSTPEMKDVRGTLEFRVAGQDAADNKGSAGSGLKVTRWKWVFDAGIAISGNPAVGNRGTLLLRHQHQRLPLGGPWLSWPMAPRNGRPPREMLSAMWR